MAWAVDNIPDQSGRVAVITGANGGLGLVTTRALVARGAHVVMAVRDPVRTGHAVEAIRTAVPDARLDVVPLDLASLQSVRACAERIASARESIDLLVNNAGVMAIPRAETADGFEMQLGVNHLGHFALTAHLFPLLLRGNVPRVVTVSSGARHFSPGVSTSDPHLQQRYGPWRSYGQSKLANLQFSLELQRRVDAAGAALASVAADPGFSATDLQAHSHRASGGGWTQAFFYRARLDHRLHPRGRCPAPASRCHRPRGEGRRDLRPEVDRTRGGGSGQGAETPPADCRRLRPVGALGAGERRRVRRHRDDAPVVI